MKKLYIKIMVMAITILSFRVSYASDPEYSLNVKNITNIDASTIQFEIFLKNTNPGNVLKYIGGQFIFKFDTLFANGGTVSYSLAPGNPPDISDLPSAYLPIKFAVRRSELLMSGTPVVEDTVQPVISSTGDGTKIISLRLHTSASSFSGESNLKWKNRIGAGPTTALLLLVNNVAQKVKDSTAHYIESPSQTNADITLAIQGLVNTETNSLFRKASVTAYLRNINSPFTIVDSAISVTDSLTLTGHFIFANASSGTYYIALKHKNSIETWSKSGGEVFTSGGNVSYNFTTSLNQSFGNNLVYVGSVAALYSGDVTQDGVIDLSDLNIVFNDAGSFSLGNVVSDLNGDELVDLSDLTLVFNNSSLFVSTIQP